VGSHPQKEPASKGGARRVVHNLALPRISPHFCNVSPIFFPLRPSSGAGVGRRASRYAWRSKLSAEMLGGDLAEPPFTAPRCGSVAGRPNFKISNRGCGFAIFMGQMFNFTKIQPATGDSCILDLVRFAKSASIFGLGGFRAGRVSPASLQGCAGADSDRG